MDRGQAVNIERIHVYVSNGEVWGASRQIMYRSRGSQFTADHGWGARHLHHQVNAWTFEELLLAIERYSLNLYGPEVRP
jgi:hypothetical protein